jgi:hypothetical protein
MEDIKYRFINLNSISTKVHNKQIPKYLPFNEAYNLYQKARHIGKTDDGWAHIVEVNNSHYHVTLDSGHVYMTEIEILK